MSAFAALFQRDGSPVARHQLVEMTDRMPHRGPDGTGHWVSGSVALGHCALHTLSEDVGQIQPIASADAQLHLTFDGRVDNRDDLLPSLGLPNDVSDARIVMAAYEEWGQHCPERLLGDFAFVVHDAREQLVFCVRDHMGIRPFFYFLSENLFLAASERAPLFTSSTVSRKANEAIVAGLLMLEYFGPNETIHRDILRLPPATCMTVTRSSVTTRRYWEVENVAPVRYRTEQDYADHLWSVLRSATRCRLRSAGPAGMLLSGGVDSTTVATAAAGIQKEKDSSAVAAFSLVFPGQSCDESDFIRTTSNQLSLDHHSFSPTFRSPGAYEDDVRRYLDLPDYANGAFLDDLRQTARNRGVNVLLTGCGGDEWFRGSDLGQIDWLWQLRLPTMLRQARLSASGLSLFKYLYLTVVRPNLPGSWVRCRRKLRLKSLIPAWMDLQFAKRVRLIDRMATGCTWNRRVAAHHDTLESYQSGELSFWGDFIDRLNARFQLEFRHPLHDVRLIEFAHGMPIELQKFNGVTKRALRQAGANRAPDFVLTRNTKAEFSRHTRTELSRHMPPDFFKTVTLSDFGWVNPEKVREVHRHFLESAKQPFYRNHRRLWHLFGFELMARSGAISN